jgi:D-aminoacyl-tRNA deacylase
MRAVVQRVSRAGVRVADQIVGRINCGYLILLGIGREDSEADADFLVDRIVGMRVFEDTQGKMNLALDSVGGGLLVVSQFTLFADTRQRRRPSRLQRRRTKRCGSISIFSRERTTAVLGLKQANSAPTWRSSWSMMDR